MRFRAVLLLGHLLGSSMPAMAEDDSRIIVRLSYVAGAVKCAQAGLVFAAEDVDRLATAVRIEADAASMAQADRDRLWTLGQMMAISDIGADSCGQLRDELPTWFPDL